MAYKKLQVEAIEARGVYLALHAMRLPKEQTRPTTAQEDFALARKLIKAGDDHAKFTRGIVVWCKITCQIGWLIEYLTYRVGVECLSSSSSMHNELKGMTGEELANKKQNDLSDKVYTRVEMISYQALRRMYLARKNHRHPDWSIFCEWIETRPFFSTLIYPEGYTDE